LTASRKKVKVGGLRRNREEMRRGTTKFSIHNPSVRSPKQSKHLSISTWSSSWGSCSAAVTTDEVSVASPDADKALRPVTRGKAHQGLDFLTIRPKHGDRSQARCLGHNETSPAGSNIEQVANHCEGRHLASSRRELIVNVDRLQRLGARDQLAAVEPVEDSPAGNIPLVDYAARVEVAEDALLVLRGHDAENLSKLETVTDNVLVGDHRVGERR